MGGRVSRRSLVQNLTLAQKSHTQSAERLGGNGLCVSVMNVLQGATTKVGT